SHHERPDGQGYPRGIRGEQIPLGARVLAVADAFDELTHAGPDGPGLSVSAAIDRLRQESGARFDAAVLAALMHVLDVPPVALPGSPPRQEWPNGLTAREVEVLRLLATGGQPVGPLLAWRRTRKCHRRN